MTSGNVGKRSLWNIKFRLLLLALYLYVFVVPAGTFFVNNFFGLLAGTAVGLLGLVGLWTLSRFVWIVSDRNDRRMRDEFRQQYRRIFRVTVLPSNVRSLLIPKGAQIKVGDFGWEAEPVRLDGLIYLQGLTDKWLVVWHGGFRLDQIEYVGLKTVSQYDWRDFEFVGQKPMSSDHFCLCTPKEPCPYPVLPRDNAIAMGPAMNL